MTASIDERFYHGDRRKMSGADCSGLKEDIFREAESGNPHMMMLAGRLYYEGFCVKQDYTAARKWFEKAHAAGDDWGTIYLAYCYYYGRQIPVNYEKAFTLFSEAAAQNNHCAFYKLGDMYRDGLYVNRDGKKAFSCYKKAIGLIDRTIPEYPNIAARIGHCLAEGIGCQKDLIRAMHWLHKAQEGCYTLLLTGDPYAHLSLPQIESDLDKIIDSLKHELSDLPENVQYS